MDGGGREQGSGRCWDTSTAPDRPKHLQAPGAIMDNGKDRQTAWPAMAWDWESMVRAGPGRVCSQANPAPLCVPGLKSWEGPWNQVKAQPGSPCHPGNPALDIGSTAQHQARQEAGGICGSQGTAPTFRSPQALSSLSCPRPGAASQQRC